MRRLLLATLLAIGLPAAAIAQQIIPGVNFIQTVNGTAGAPSKSYLQDRDLGSYRIGENNEGFTAGGTLRWDYNTTRINTTIPILGADGSAGAVTFGFASAPTTGAYLTGGNINVAIAGSARFQFNSGAFYTPAVVLDISNSDVVLTREASGHFFQKNSTNAQRASWANTYASSTNYEAFSIDWLTTANTAIVGSRTAATGTSRAVMFGSQGDNGTTAYAAIRIHAGSLPFIQQGLINASGTNITTATAGTFFQQGHITSSATSGTIINTAILPTYNQSSGTAANCDLCIDRTETAVGSGQQLLIGASTSGTRRFYITAGGATGRGTQEAFTQAVAPTCTSANNCGTGNGTFATGSSDTAGTVTLGTTPASGFIITFNGTWVAAPVCTVWMAKAGMAAGKQPLTTVTSTTQVTVVTNGTAPATGDIYSYRCTGLQ